MADSDDKYTPNEDDRAVWENYVNGKSTKSEENTQEENFQTLLDKTEISEETLNEKKPPAPQQEKELQTKKRKTVTSSTLPQLDRRTEQRLRKGKIPIEGRIDLHGMTKTQAHENLLKFIINCYDKNLRCILVITGKGKDKTTSKTNNWQSPSKGVLKENVPFWLSATPLKEIILKFVPAQPKNGGSGALYVYLKR